MERKAAARARIPEVLTKVLFALLILIFLFCSVCSLLWTCTIDPHDYIKEHILFQTDSFWLNLGVLAALFLVCAVLLIRFGSRIRKKHVRIAGIVMLCWTFALSMIWMTAVRSVPTADSRYVLEAASSAAKNDFSFFSSKQHYFQMFPYQLGIVAIYEGINRLFGGAATTAMYALNAASLTAACWAIVVLAERVFSDRRVTLLTILALMLCVQPILYTSFLYGSLIGLAAMLWACVLLLRFLVSGRNHLIVWIALLCAFSVTAKQNNWIGVAAICIVLLLSLIRRFRFSGIVCALAVVLAPILALGAIQSSYESRAGVQLGEGTPQTAWLVMGLSDSERAPGWYNGYTYSVLKEAGMDTEQAKAAIRRDLSERLDALSSDRAYAADFFYKKVLSQWNEPSFESVWVSKAREHESALPAFAANVYDGALGDALNVYFEHGVTFLYSLFAAGLLAMLIRRRGAGNLLRADAERRAPDETTAEARALLPLIILGGFLYHLLFEAKSQYALVYLPMMLPYAAFGLVRSADALRCLLTKRNARRIPA